MKIHIKQEQVERLVNQHNWVVDWLQEIAATTTDSETATSALKLLNQINENWRNENQ